MTDERITELAYDCFSRGEMTYIIESKNNLTFARAVECAVIEELREKCKSNARVSRIEGLAGDAEGWDDIARWLDERARAVGP